MSKKPMVTIPVNHICISGSDYESMIRDIAESNIFIRRLQKERDDARDDLVLARTAIDELKEELEKVREELNKERDYTGHLSKRVVDLKKQLEAADAVPETS